VSAPTKKYHQMKAIFIIYAQSHTEPIEEVLDRLGIRGFTRWEETHGRGTQKGEPHYGTHAWPTKNGTILTIVENQKAEALLKALKRINEEAEQQGLRAFVWEAESGV
jgi:nitrogen regulatory protein PII